MNELNSNLLVISSAGSFLVSVYSPLLVQIQSTNQIQAGLSCMQVPSKVEPRLLKCNLKFIS